MNFRLTGLLAILAAALGLLILFWDQDDDTARARLELARRAFRFDPARVDRLQIEADDFSIECQLRGRQWHLVRPIAARADPVAIERLLGALQELPRGNIILPSRRTADAYAPYGLDHPRAEIAIIAGTATNRILVGRRTPLGDGVYVRQSDHAGLARLSPALLDLLPTSADALRDRSLLTGTAAAIEHLDIRGPAGYIQLALDDSGEWRMFQPSAARVDPAFVAGLVDTLLACAVIHFVQDGVSDLSPYGLDSQNAVTAVLNTDSGDGSQLLSFGDPLPNDPTLVYARLQGENSVYAVPAAVRQALLVRPDDLRNRRVPGIEPDSIRRIRIEEKESALEFTRNGDGFWELTAPLRAPADAETIQALIQSWADVRLAAFAEIPSGPSAPAWSRVIRITPRRTSAAPIVLRLGANPDDPASARIAIEGETSGALATPARLLDFPLDPLRYRSRHVLSVPADDVARIRIAATGQTLELERDPDTGQWTPAAPWIDRLLDALDPLRAEALLADGETSEPRPDFAAPYLTIAVQLLGQSGLATTLLVGDELSPGGPRRATLRGRGLVFALSPQTVEALRPPPADKTE